MKPITGHNHFVPDAYLRRWSFDGHRLCAYEILVPHQSVPLWRPKYIRGLAYREHLYTSMMAGAESDSFERWLNETIEIPAQAALQRIVDDRPLDSDHWEHLIRYAAAQDLRTPAAFLDHMERMNRTVPELLDKTLVRSVAKLTRAQKRGRTLPSSSNQEQYRLPLRVDTQPNVDGDGGQLRAEITIGRETWLHSMHHLLTKTVRVLLRHNWRVVRPSPGSEWFTSDHPVLRLNYYKDGSYDFGGGWGRRGAEFIFPLSPQHLLYTQVGHPVPERETLSTDLTFRLQKLLAERAHRWIFARQRVRRVEWFRPRTVNAKAFAAEQQEWKKWHTEQSAAVRAG